MPTLLSRAGIPALLLSSSLLAQTVVSGGGPALQNAIAAATLGDTLLVQAGDYDSVIVSQGLTVLCEPGVRVFSATAPCVSVSGLPAGQTVRWYGGEMVQGGVVAEFRVFFCDGVVEVEGVESENCITNFSAQASFTACEFTLRTTVDASTVVFSNCVLDRQVFCIGANCSGLEVVAGGRALVTDCVISGAPPLSFFAASPGLYVNDGVVVLSGAGTSVSAGSATVAPVRFGGLGGVVDADALVQINGTPENGAVTASTTPAIATVGGVEGDTVAVTTYSEPGSFAFALVGFPLPRTPTPLGELWMLPPVVTVSAGLVPANGTLPGSFSIPVGAFGQSLTFQPAALLSGGGIVLGNPTVALYR